MGIARLDIRAGEFSADAVRYRGNLQNRVLPYWLESTRDTTNGGYLLCDDAVAGRCTPSEKQLVSQARMVWGFSLAHRSGLGQPKAGLPVAHDYLAAATDGVRFLRQHFLDPKDGGYFFTTDLAGHPQNRRKLLYGQAFVLYALVEYHQASGDAQSLTDAMVLYRDLQRHAHDSVRGGWMEHFEADWTPLPERNPNAIVEIAGFKSANSHLHLMEALTELYSETKDPQVRESLEEALRLNQTYFYPLDASRASFHFRPDWTAVTDSGSTGLSYGHNVEFAWLMVRAERALGHSPSWVHFRAHLDHALAYGWDAERGGVYNRGVGNEPANDTAKVWWVQAEMMAALAEAVQQKDAPPRYAQALHQLIQFVDRFQTEPKDGIWVDTVTADGKPRDTRKAHSWKANYHDVRGMLMFADAFGREP